MGEDKDSTTALVVKAGTEVVKDVYADGLKRTVVAVGDAVGSVVEVGAEVVTFLAGTLGRGFKRLTDRIAGRVDEIPMERRQIPSSRLLMQASVAYASLDESPDTDPLRIMFEDLLLASMDCRYADDVHPSTVAMLSQMTSTDGWMLKSIGTRTSWPTMTTALPAPTGERRLGMVTTLGADLALTQRHVLVSLTNLARLGILELSLDVVAILEEDGELHDRYEELGRIAAAAHEGAFELRELRTYPGSISVTELGQLFLDTCVRPKVG
jgi:hypothetical protein